jgi:hypothetical protein
MRVSRSGQRPRKETWHLTGENFGRPWRSMLRHYKGKTERAFYLGAA